MKSFAVLFSSAIAVEYCPTAEDLTWAYSPENIKIVDQGWTNTGGGGAATKSTFNLNGGYVEYDIDFSEVKTGVNANLYTVAPTVSGKFYNHTLDYCDGQGANQGFCCEMDFIESNGNCGGATTWHAFPGGGSDRCTAWGCASDYMYNGKAKFHMKIQYDSNGSPTVFRDGAQMTGFNPSPQSQDMAVFKRSHEEKGAVIVSTMWVGWVPEDQCGGSSGESELEASKFSVTNLKISGSVVQGPTPAECGAPVPSPTPSPAPTPTPTPTPTPSDCPGGSLDACIDLCPADIFAACVSSCQTRCPHAQLV